jgi:hypothetical protein
MKRCASSPRKYVQADSGVARTRLRMPFCRRVGSTIASWLEQEPSTGMAAIVGT